MTPENATFFHLNNASGALISQVEADSPAAKGRNQSWRRDHRTQRQEDGEFRPASGRHQRAASGDKVTLGVMRDGKSLTVPGDPGIHQQEV